MWISEGDDGFWQDIIFERVTSYCGACRHLGHSQNECYIARPELRVVLKPKNSDATQNLEKKEETRMKNKGKSQYVIRVDCKDDIDAHTTVETSPKATVSQDLPMQQAIYIDTQAITCGHEHPITNESGDQLRGNN